MSETESKTKPASPRKLQKQRTEGVVPLVADVAALLSAGLSLATLAFMLPITMQYIWDTILVVELATSLPFAEAVNVATRNVARLLSLIILPVLAVSIGASVITAIIYNKGFVFSLKPITPNAGRMSPVMGFTRIFGKRSIIETGVNFARLFVWFGFVAVVVTSYLPDVIQASYCGSRCAVEMAFQILIWMIVGAVVLLLISSGFEMILQKSLFLGEQRMTESEVKKEAKEMAGSPEVKKEQRRLRQEALEGAEASSVDKANMCFYWKECAVAIRYHPTLAPVPRVSAKSRSIDKSHALRARVKENGFRELESQDIIETCISTQVGGMINEEGQRALVEGLTAMFAR